MGFTYENKELFLPEVPNTFPAAVLFSLKMSSNLQKKKERTKSKKEKGEGG